MERRTFLKASALSAIAVNATGFIISLKKSI
jgi:hypothetical protein